MPVLGIAKQPLARRLWADGSRRCAVIRRCGSVS
jgi:hypothetical protein